MEDSGYAEMRLSPFTGQAGAMWRSTLLVTAACTTHVQSPGRDQIDAPPASWERAAASVGTVLGSHTFLTVDGGKQTVNFADSHPRAILAMTGQDCTSCGPIVLDAWELNRWAQGVGGSLVIVISTDSPSTVSDFARSSRFPLVPLVDTGGWFRTAFGGNVHPIAAIVGTKGTILAIHNRSPRYANSRLLRSALDEMNSIFAPRRRGHSG